MELWLDTTDLKTIEKAKRMGLLHGVSTDPSMLASYASPMEIIEAILTIQGGPVAVPLIGENADEMIEQGKKLRAHSLRLIAKIPVRPEGLEAIHALAKENIPTMASVIYHPNQALLAAISGASYVAPFFSRMQKSGENPLVQIESMMEIMRKYHFQTKVIAASLKTTEQIRSCAELGFHGAALKEDLFADLTDTHELTALAVEQFLSEWKGIVV